MWQLSDWGTADVDVDSTAPTGEESEHVRWRGTMGKSLVIVATVIILVVNSDVVNGSKVISDVAQ